MAAERIRQTAFDQQAQALNTESQDMYGGFQDDQAAKSTELGDYFADQKIEAASADAAATEGQGVIPTGSNVTVAEESKQRGKADAYGGRQARALGNLRAFGDVLAEDSRQQARNASEVGQIGGFKRGSANVLPLELEAANSAGAKAQMFGDILNLGGSLALNKGLSGGAMTGTTPTLSPMVGGTKTLTDPWAGARRAPVYSPIGTPGSSAGLYSMFR